MKRYVDGAWEGWKGDTLVRLTDGSVWEQIEYRYEYRYAYRPEVTVDRDRMLVAGMHGSVRVRRVS